MWYAIFESGEEFNTRVVGHDNWEDADAIVRQLIKSSGKKGQWFELKYKR